MDEPAFTTFDVCLHFSNGREMRAIYYTHVAKTCGEVAAMLSINVEHSGVLRFDNKLFLTDQLTAAEVAPTAAAWLEQARQEHGWRFWLWRLWS
jgi:3-methyladenine DNA glycosylase Mpg